MSAREVVPRRSDTPNVYFHTVPNGGVMLSVELPMFEPDPGLQGPFLARLNADEPHSYQNPGVEDAVVHLVMSYA